jgi:hypothetical protein
MVEVKSALLQSFQGGEAVLVIVDEDYELHTITADVNTLCLILEGADLPGLRWRHSTKDPAIRVVERRGGEYRHRAQGGDALGLIEEYRKRKAAASHG